jgi:hypothetical protein
MSEVSKLKVRATITTLGLSPGEEVEIEVTDSVQAAVSLGHLIILADKPAKVAELPQEAPEALTGSAAPAKRSKRTNKLMDEVAETS